MTIRSLIFICILCVLGRFAGIACAADNYCKTTEYRSYEEIQGDLSGLSGDFARVFTIGTTSEGRDIQAILITQGANSASGSGPTLTTGKPAVVITGGIHADEWPGPEEAVGLAEYLVENAVSTEGLCFPIGADNCVSLEPKEAIYKNLTVKNLLKAVEIVIIPMLNPDGYEFSRMSDSNKDWRKNRRVVFTDPDGRPVAYGVDLNRNFPDPGNFRSAPVLIWYSPAELFTSGIWEDDSNATLARTDPSSNTYWGPATGSEPEMQALMAVYNGRNVKASVDYHSNGNEVLYPWAYTAEEILLTNKTLRYDKRTRDVELFKAVANKMVNSINPAKYRKTQHYYVKDLSALEPDGDPNALYVKYTGAVTSRDWGYGSKSIASFGVEVGDFDEYRHQPPGSELPLLCAENIGGALWLMFWAGDQGFRQKRTILEDEQIKDRRLKIRSAAVPVEP